MVGQRLDFTNVWTQAAKDRLYIEQGVEFMGYLHTRDVGDWSKALRELGGRFADNRNFCDRAIYQSRFCYLVMRLPQFLIFLGTVFKALDKLKLKFFAYYGVHLSTEYWRDASGRVKFPDAVAIPMTVEEDVGDEGGERMKEENKKNQKEDGGCLLYTSPSPRD